MFVLQQGNDNKEKKLNEYFAFITQSTLVFLEYLLAPFVAFSLAFQKVNTFI